MQIRVGQHGVQKRRRVPKTRHMFVGVEHEAQRSASISLKEYRTGNPTLYFNRIARHYHRAALPERLLPLNGKIQGQLQIFD